MSFYDPVRSAAAKLGMKVDDLARETDNAPGQLAAFLRGEQWDHAIGAYGLKKLAEYLDLMVIERGEAVHVARVMDRDQLHGSVVISRDVLRDARNPAAVIDIEVERLRVLLRQRVGLDDVTPSRVRDQDDENRRTLAWLGKNRPEVVQVARAATVAEDPG